MYVRGYHSAIASNSTENYVSKSAPASGTGNLFVGGEGVVGVANSTDYFLCAGGDASLVMVNKGSNAIIQGGSGKAGYIDLDLDGDGTSDTWAANNIISVGLNNKITGSDKTDVVFSLGENGDIALGKGDDKFFVSGEGSSVNGEEGDDVIAGTPAGLEFGTLYGMDVIDMLAEICNKSSSIIYNSAE